jgi:hypothetical protein
MPADYLDLRALNRATLSRQLLLRRSALTPAQAVAHLAGLQAQAPRAPYVGLQARLASFRPEQLENLLNERGVLRAHLMRNTVHLLTAADYTRSSGPSGRPKTPGMCASSGMGNSWSGA